MDRKSEVTRLLGELAAGNASAFDRLIPLVYDDLRHIARRHLRRNGGNFTLNTTALVHEAYLRLVERSSMQWSDRGHFLAVYSVVIRNLLVDIARRRHSARRGGGQVRVPLDENAVVIDHQADRLLAVDRALSRLAGLDPRLARVVECRYFAGLTDEETAQALSVTPRTVQRDWAKARALMSEWIDAT